MGLTVGKLYLGWPNRVTAGVSVSGGSWLSALPAANVLDREMTKVARSVSLASTYIDVDFGTSRTLRAFALCNHNLSRSATWRVQLGSALGLADVFDSGEVAVWLLNFDTANLEWQDANWWAGNYDDDVVGHPFASIYLAPADKSARYIRITIDDVHNPKGYVQLGRIFAGDGVQPKYNMSYGMGDAWESLSQVEATPGGTEYFDERRACRVSQFTLDHLDQQTEFRTFYEMQRRLGTTGEVLYIPDAYDMAATQLTGFLGRMRTLSPIEYPYFNSRKAAFELKELL